MSSISGTSRLVERISAMRLAGYRKLVSISTISELLLGLKRPPTRKDVTRRGGSGKAPMIHEAADPRHPRSKDFHPYTHSIESYEVIYYKE